MPTPRPPGDEVKITLDSDNCPTGIDNANIALDPGDQKRFTWVVDYPADGDESTRLGFCVIFDPFAGRQLCTQGRNITRLQSQALSRKVINAKEPILYKYTVFLKGCPDELLDPWIRVAR